MATVKPILQSALRTEWAHFEGIAALRCTAGVAVPLVVGLLLDQPSVCAFGAIGAVSVGFRSPTPAMVEDETDLMVDSVKTVAALLGATSLRVRPHA